MEVERRKITFKNCERIPALKTRLELATKLALDDSPLLILVKPRKEKGREEKRRKGGALCDAAMLCWRASLFVLEEAKVEREGLHLYLANNGILVGGRKKERREERGGGSAGNLTTGRHENSCEVRLIAATRYHLGERVAETKGEGKGEGERRGARRARRRDYILLANISCKSSLVAGTTHL